MSDEKEDLTNFDEQLAKIVNQKSRKRSKNDIYKRFISRVDSSDSNNQNNLKPLESAKQLRAFEPLSAAELQLFEDDNESVSDDNNDKKVGLELVEIKKTNATFDFSNQSVPTENKVEDIEDATDNASADSPLSATNRNEPLPTHNAQVNYASKNADSAHNQVEDIEQSTVKPDLIPSEKQPQRSPPNNKILIIAVVIVSLLIAVGMALFITGGLSASTSEEVSTASDSNDSSTESVAPEQTALSTPPVNSETTGAETIADVSPAADDNNAANEATPTAKTSVSTKTNESSLSENAATPADNEPDVSTEAQPAISYEDFREESQTTLYRETND